MNLGLEGRVAVVTGASSGIGRATASMLAAEGARVVLVARSEGPLGLVVDEIRAAGGSAVGVAADVADPGSADVIVGAAEASFGPVEVLVNSAGGQTRSPKDRTDTFDEDVWMHLYRLNVVSAVRLSTRCIDGMTQRGWGRIVNVGSVNGRDTDARFGPYGAAKAALLHATGTLAQAYGDRNILVNVVLPGLTRTEGVEARLVAAADAKGVDAQHMAQRMMARRPIALGRLGESDEVAAAIVFLCSEPASWITGSSLLVDGGTLHTVP
jgi:NAD(P)-dependent dehydrogenase (short-subunit alcohol dehydrogenase family)